MPHSLRHTAIKIGLVCLTLSLLAIAASLPLGCLLPALTLGSFSLFDGMLLGTALALITRTRLVWLIYLLLALAAFTLWPLFQEWPAGNAWDIHPWQGAPALVYGYLDAERMLLFLLGIPAPFALLGQHGPDRLPLASLTPEERPDESEKP